MRWNDEERRGFVRAVGAQRLLAVPAFVVAGVAQHGGHSQALLALGAVLVALNTAVLRRLSGPAWRSVPLPALLAFDCVAIASAIALSGGSASHNRFLALLLIVSIGVCMPRSLLLRMAGLLVGLCAVPVVLMGEEEVFDFFVVAAFATLAAASLSRVGEEATARLAALAAERRTLLASALDAEHGTRRLLAQDVHDRALQTLLAARQDLEEAADGAGGAMERGRRGVDEAILAVRDTVHELHSGALTGQLADSLAALAARVNTEGRVRAQVHVDPVVSRHEELLFAVARQLTADAVARDGTTAVQLWLRQEGDEVVLEVADDGAHDTRANGLPRATSAERLAEAGGSLRVEPASTGGTRVRARLPV